MGRILRCVIILLVAYTNLVNFRVVAKAMSTVAKSFETHGVVPDVISKAPAALVTVKYPSGAVVEEGNELSPMQVRQEPSVSWNAEPDAFYTVAMVDPDAPSRKEPKFREFRHWLVGNVLGEAISSGEVLTAYFGSRPPVDTGLHRYVFLVYRQPGKLNFDESSFTNPSSENRRGFSIAKFASKYCLGDPVAGNFYQAQYDGYIPPLQ